MEGGNTHFKIHPEYFIFFNKATFKGNHLQEANLLGFLSVPSQHGEREIPVQDPSIHSIMPKGVKKKKSKYYRLPKSLSSNYGPTECACSTHHFTTTLLKSYLFQFFLLNIPC